MLVSELPSFLSSEEVESSLRSAVAQESNNAPRVLDKASRGALNRSAGAALLINEVITMVVIKSVQVVTRWHSVPAVLY